MHGIGAIVKDIMIKLLIIKLQIYMYKILTSPLFFFLQTKTHILLLLLTIASVEPSKEGNWGEKLQQ